MFVCSLLCDSDHGKLMTKCIEIIKITNAPSEVIAIICGSGGSSEDRRREESDAAHHSPHYTTNWTIARISLNNISEIHRRQNGENPYLPWRLCPSCRLTYRGS